MKQHATIVVTYQ